MDTRRTTMLASIAVLTASTAANASSDWRWFSLEHFYASVATGQTNYTEADSLARDMLQHALAKLPAAPGGVTEIETTEVASGAGWFTSWFGTLGYDITPHISLEVGAFTNGGSMGAYSLNVFGHTSAVGGNTAGHDVRFAAFGDFNTDGQEVSLRGGWPIYRRLAVFGRAGSLHVTAKGSMLGCGRCTHFELGPSGEILSETKFPDTFYINHDVHEDAWVPFGSAGLSFQLDEDSSLRIRAEYRFARVPDSLGTRTAAASYMFGVSGHFFGY